MTVSYWGRYCRACECLTGSDDPAWPNCWFCGDLLILAPAYDPVAQLGRAPSMNEALTLEELLKEPECLSP